MAASRDTRGRWRFLWRSLRSGRVWLVIVAVLLAVATVRVAFAVASARVQSERIQRFVGRWVEVGGVSATGQEWTVAERTSRLGTGRAVDVVGVDPATMLVETDGLVQLTPHRLRLRQPLPPLPYPDHLPVMRWSVDGEGRLLNERWLRKHGHCITGYLSPDGSQLRVVLELQQNAPVTMVFGRATATR